MQSRRLEDFAPQSPTARARERRFGVGSDPYSNSRRDGPERRSLSPHKMDGARRIQSGDRRSDSVERREYVWDLGGGGGGGGGNRGLSRSPPLAPLQKGPHFDDEEVEEGMVVRRQLEIGRRGEAMQQAQGFSGETSNGLKHLYGYDHNSSRIRKDKALSFNDTRLPTSERHGMLVQKEITMEDGSSVRGYVRLAPDLGPGPASNNYDLTGGAMVSAVRDSDISRYKDERFRYRNSLPKEKLSVMEPSYKEEEKPMLYARDISYSMVPSHRPKEISSSTQFKEPGSTSLSISRADLQVPYQNDPPLPSDDFPRKQTESLGFRGYGRRLLVESERNSDAQLIEHHDYLYSKTLGRESDDFGYPSDDLYRKMPALARVDYDHRDSLRPGIVEPFVDNIDDINISRGNLRDRSIPGHSSLQERSSNYLDMKRTSNASKQGGLYLGSGSNRLDYQRQVSRDPEILNSGVLHDHEISHLRSHYVSGGDANPGSRKERLKIIPVSESDLEMHRLAMRRQRMKAEELDIYDQSDRILKRKHSMDEDISRYSSRNIVTSKWYMPMPRGQLGDSSEEIFNEDMAGLVSTKPMKMELNEYRKSERNIDDRVHHRGSAYDDWLSSQDPMEYEEERPIKSYKSGGRYIRGHTRLNSLSWNNSYHFDKRSYPNKQHKVWKRIKDDYYDDMVAKDIDPSEEEDWENPAKSEPPEDSEEFKQMVHKSFLKFSKKLNENPAVRRRYKEQGQAGSLFCIVCGRSNSKEFMDTQRLVTHAYMSHKFGLRAEHLGLHKAICVLLGWNSVVPPDTITWVPHVLPSHEALAQKEDLILWPPLVIIHNISISNSNPDEWKLVTIEALGAFLRGKGFGGGRFKMCLGKPADHSVMVVKFLGTFSGLEDAVKLHKYYAENNHGRAELEKMNSNNGKSSSNNVESGTQSKRPEEDVLYGYMGIVEDLDKLDFDTKRRCLIQSKQEIQDLADAPVKPD